MKLTLLSLMGLAAFAMADEVDNDVDGFPKKPPGPGPFVPSGPVLPGGPLVPGSPGPVGPGGPLAPPHSSKPFGDGPGKWTTSTVYSTTVKTIISCPPEKPSCPATSTRVTTVIVPVSTTICPVATPTSSDKPYPTPPSPTKPPPPPPPPPTSTDKPKTLPPPVTAPPPPPKPPVTTTAKSIGTTGLPPKPTATSVVTAGAAHLQRAGGALAAIAVAAVLL